jgi:acetyl esterase/lipase
MFALRFIAIQACLGCLFAAAPAVAQAPVSPPAAAGNPSPLAFAEDWNTLSIRSLHLEAYPPVVTEHDVRSDYTRDLVRVQWRPGDSIELFVYVPRGVPKAPAVLYLYSYPADVDRFFDEGWATRATANGYAAVGFVSALTGQRYHSRPMKEWFVSQLPESLGASVHDVQMILDYLATRGDIDMNRIGMFGQGSGGSIAILAASVDRRIQALDLLDPWGDWPDWLRNSPQVPEDERSRYLTPEFLNSVSNLDPVDAFSKLSLHSLRLQQILADSVTPRSAMDRIAAAAPSPKVVFRYPDSNAHFKAVRATGLSGWLKDQLALPASPASAARGGR